MLALFAGTDGGLVFDHIVLALLLLLLPQQGNGSRTLLALDAGTDGGIVCDDIALELLLRHLSQQGIAVIHCWPFTQAMMVVL